MSALPTVLELNALVLETATEFPTELPRADYENLSDILEIVTSDVGEWALGHWGPVGVTLDNKEWPIGPFLVTFTLDGYQSMNLPEKDGLSFSGDIEEVYSSLSVEITIRLVD